MSFIPYLIVPESEVPGNKRNAAALGMGRVAAEFGEEMPEPIWMVPHPRDLVPTLGRCHTTRVPVWGETVNELHGQKVYLNADASVEQLVDTSAHEARHVCQFRKYGKLLDEERDEWEAEAVACATHHSARLTGEVASLSVTALDVIDADLARAQAREWSSSCDPNERYKMMNEKRA